MQQEEFMIRQATPPIGQEHGAPTPANAITGGTSIADDCPFCGSKDLRIRLNWVECYSCCAYGPNPNEGETSVDAWNRRLGVE